ncbi:LTXXQ motif family protein [Noviherbaspirillum humi]|uniref:LTXXQ motif family protein n=2 Tax=Noviherbaspirillum humi TaxID=1688639 RepID=A0A239HBJ8_9BURK|nr:LTXXQ motif family protein [Noviherbaspirillum humi]
MEKNMIRILTAGAVAMSVAACAGAQSQQSQMGGPGMRMQHHMGEEHEQHHAEHMREMMTRRLQQLHDKLQLNASQETAWNNYVARLRQVPAQRPDRADMAKLSVPDRMERHLAMMREAEKRMTDHLAATREFYAVLSPEQQKIFNEQFPAGRGNMRSGRMQRGEDAGKDTGSRP